MRERDRMSGGVRVLLALSSTMTLLGCFSLAGSSVAGALGYGYLAPIVLGACLLALGYGSLRAATRTLARVRRPLG